MEIGDRFRAITSSYYRGALGALLIYDITRRVTFDSARDWLREVRECGEEDTVVVLVGNKSDLADHRSREVAEEEAKSFAETEGLCFLETSALKNSNVEEAFLQMITRIHDATSQKFLEAKIDETRRTVPKIKEVVTMDEVTATRQSNCCSN